MTHCRFSALALLMMLAVEGPAQISPWLPTFPPAPPPVPTITSLSKTSKEVGFEMSIYGQNFNSLESSSWLVTVLQTYIKFGNPNGTSTQATVWTRASNSEIRVIVPLGAVQGPIYITQKVRSLGITFERIVTTSPQVFTPLRKPRLIIHHQGPQANLVSLRANGAFELLASPLPVGGVRETNVLDPINGGYFFEYRFQGMTQSQTLPGNLLDLQWNRTYVLEIPSGSVVVY